MKQKQHHILIIDDDEGIRSLVCDYLQQHNYKTTGMADGRTLKRVLSTHMVDLIILDLMLPGEDGLSLCQQIRQDYDTPIIILSAAQAESDRVAGLELGADDYMVKPFGARELLARIKAQLRRSSGQLATSSKRLSPLDKVQFEGWVLDRDNHSLVGCDEVAVALSQKEYELLHVFLEHPNRILSRDQLMELLYDKEGDPLDRTIDVLVGRLRKKIEQDVKLPTILKTIRGGGYQFNAKIQWGCE